MARRTPAPRVVGAIPAVVAGEIIDAPWGNQVADAINTHTHAGAAGSAGETPVAHASLSGRGPDDHHPRLHAADHAPGAADALPAQTTAIEFVIDGGGAVITAGVKADLFVPFACTITQWTLLADVAGTITVDVWRDSYANHPPVAADSLGSPAIAAAGTKAQSGAIAWAVAAGSVIRLNVAAAATVKRVTLALTATRS